MKSFNFGEALSFMEIGETMCLELDGKTRLYRMQDGEIICNVEGSMASYRVTKFYTDAVLSKEWRLYNA